MDNLFQLVEEINQMLRNQKIGNIAAYDEEQLVRTVATMFRDANRSGRIEYVPTFRLDSDATGSIVVKLDEVMV